MLDLTRLSGDGWPVGGMRVTAKIDLREELLLARLRENSRDLEELVAMGLLYDPDSPVLWAKAAERHTIGAHLDELLAAGRVACDAQGCYRAEG